jgi:non-specific serine/threonine protein kinase
MTGAEYLTAAVLESLWDEMATAFRDERKHSRLVTQDLLKRWSPAWNLVGRVHFNLAENRKDDEAPFAFLATYQDGCPPTANARAARPHLREYRGGEARRRSRLLPMQRAAQACPWLTTMVEAADLHRCASPRGKPSGVDRVP